MMLLKPNYSITSSNKSSGISSSLLRKDLDECQKSKLKQAIDARFVLLYQPAPNSFVLVPKFMDLQTNSVSNKTTSSDNTVTSAKRPRFRVTIGPQICTCLSEICSKTATITASAARDRHCTTLSAPCLHTLFVMIRVLRTPLDDAYLMEVPLPTSKVQYLIQNYAHYRNNSFKNLSKSPKVYSQSLQGETKHEPPSSFEKSAIRLMMPQPIHPDNLNSSSIPSKAPHLIALVNATLKNNHECSELSNLTQDIVPASGREIESAEPCYPSTTTTASRTSSTDSTDSSRLGSYRGGCFKNNRNAFVEQNTQRPRTAPQPELPPRIAHGKTKFIRYASSTTFRPIRDSSPVMREGLLTPIQSEESSANNSLKHKSSSNNDDYATLHQSSNDPTVKSDSKSLRYFGAFTHARRSSFRPLPSKPNATLASMGTKVSCSQLETNQLPMQGKIEDIRVVHHAPHLEHSTNPQSKSPRPVIPESDNESIETLHSKDNENNICALCLQTITRNSVLSQTNPDSSESLFRCQTTTDEMPSCGAMFHSSCCRIWLEEIQIDGDSPQCPICSCFWIHLPNTLFHTDCIPVSQSNPSGLSDLVSQDLADSKLVRSHSAEEQSRTVPSSDSKPCTENMRDQNISRGSLPVTESLCHMCAAQLVNRQTSLQQEPQTTQLQRQPIISVPFSKAQIDPPYSEYNNCASAFSIELADAIASPNWTVRQMALQQIAHITIRRVLLTRQQHHHNSKSSSSSSFNDDFDESQSNPNWDNQQTQESKLSNRSPDCVRILLRLIQHLFDDPVDAIFIDSLRAFRELLGYLVCYNTETQNALQRAVGPILRRLLRFVGGASALWTLRNIGPVPHQNSAEQVLIDCPQLCVAADSYEVTISGSSGQRDEKLPTTSFRFEKKQSESLQSQTPNLGRRITDNIASSPSSAITVTSLLAPPANLRDRSNLALAALIELAKGQAGALALGREVNCEAQCLPICGLQHMTRFVLSSAKFHATHLVGRLTLVDKLIRMDQVNSELHNQYNICPTIPNDDSSNQVATIEANNETQPSSSSLSKNYSSHYLQRRHLCSSLVFARRHLLPTIGNPNSTAFYPHHYKLQPSTGFWVTSTSRCKFNSSAMDDQMGSNVDNLTQTHIKASRMAKRVFVTAARALLSYPNRKLNDISNNSELREFCSREFVESEISRVEATVGMWLRNKLGLFICPSSLNTSSALGELTAPLTPCLPPRPSCLLVNPKHIPSDAVYLKDQCLPNISKQCTTSQKSSNVPPPLPPPRRPLIQNTELETLTISPDPTPNRILETDSDKSKRFSTSSYVRVALEPAYDLVALSESGSYSSASECEEVDERDVVKEKDDLSVPDQNRDSVTSPEPIYAGRSLGSEAELQTEQVAVLRNALNRCTRSLRPLLPIPGLSFVMEAFQSTHKLPSSDEYYESVDWIRGPILGHGAFSKCYQARDTRTGLLLAVKRIQLGRNCALPVITNKGQVRQPNVRNNNKNGDGENANENDKVEDNVNDNKRVKSTVSINQLAEVEAEIKIMLHLNHPNVLRLFGAVHCSKRDIVDLFIEWMPGGSVTSLLQQYGAFNESVTLAYGVQVVRGLAYLHKNGILHRDLKGANLLIDNTGSIVKISDFGASARLSGEESVAGQFQGQVIGTFSFMAPEVLRGETYGRACDIWSVGCCLIEMLTSKPPWHNPNITNRYALMFTIATSDSPPTYPEGLDPDVREILDSCFSRTASKRPTASRLLTFRAFARLTDAPIHPSSSSTNLSDSATPPKPKLDRSQNSRSKLHTVTSIPVLPKSLKCGTSHTSNQSVSNETKSAARVS